MAEAYPGSDCQSNCGPNTAARPAAAPAAIVAGNLQAIVGGAAGQANGGKSKLVGSLPLAAKVANSVESVLEAAASDVRYRCGRGQRSVVCFCAVLTAPLRVEAAVLGACPV